MSDEIYFLCDTCCAVFGKNKQINNECAKCEMGQLHEIDKDTKNVIVSLKNEVDSLQSTIKKLIEAGNRVYENLVNVISQNNISDKSAINSCDNWVIVAKIEHPEITK
jgi:hypothetical protein